MKHLRFYSALAAFLALGTLGISAAQAAGYPLAAYPGGIALACDNGWAYPLRIRAVSDAGEIVTGYLTIGHRQQVHVRLVPMGNGYRYAGQGVWFDGKREAAVLYFGKGSPISCSILRDGADQLVVSAKS
jgi:hypothetical protein